MSLKLLSLALIITLFTGCKKECDHETSDSLLLAETVWSGVRVIIAKQDFTDVFEPIDSSECIIEFYEKGLGNFALEGIHPIGSGAFSYSCTEKVLNIIGRSNPIEGNWFIKEYNSETFILERYDTPSLSQEISLTKIR